MYVVRWIGLVINSLNYLSRIDNGGRFIWNKLQHAKLFYSINEAEKYITSDRGIRYWSIRTVTVIYVHPLNISHQNTDFSLWNLSAPKK